MNTLNDLRATLGQHAHDLPDDPSVARVAAVQVRARRIRRQRAGAVVAAAALAGVGIVAVPVLVDRTPPVPAERLLAGQVAPAEMTSLGYTYAFAEGAESGDRAASIRLRASDQPRLVTWASDAEQVRLRSPYAEGRTSPDTRFDDFVVVDPGERGRWTLRARGADSALAVYTLTDERPPGVTVGGLHFRGQVGSDEVAGAVMGARGKGEASLELTLPEGGVRIAEYCTGIPFDGLWVNVGQEGQGPSGTQGCDDDDHDPATSGQSTWYEPGQLGEPGETVTLRTWVSRKFDGPVAEVDEDVQLGLAAYAVGKPAAVIAGWDVPHRYEFDGKVWDYSHAESVGIARSGRVDTVNRGAEQVLAVGYFRGAGQRVVRFRYGGGYGTDVRNSGGSGGDLTALLGPGERASLGVRGGASARGELGFAVYRRVD